MSVIAFDGYTLAADRMVSTASGIATTTIKITYNENGLYGAAGDLHIVARLMRWATDTDCNPDLFPDIKDLNGAELVAIRIKGERITVTEYLGPVGTPALDKQVAYGCGRNQAMTCMRLGMDALAAVEHTCEFNIYCGMGTDAYTVDDVRAVRE